MCDPFDPAFGAVRTLLRVYDLAAPRAREEPDGPFPHSSHLLESFRFPHEGHIMLTMSTSCSRVFAAASRSLVVPTGRTDGE